MLPVYGVIEDSNGTLITAPICYARTERGKNHAEADAAWFLMMADETRGLTGDEIREVELSAEYIDAVELGEAG